MFKKPGDKRSDIWIDISVPLEETLPIWPGSIGLRVSRIMSLERGDPANVTRLDCDVHTGTHVESSLHFIGPGCSLDQIPLDVFIGSAWVGHLPQATAIGVSELDSLCLPEDVRRLLLRTGNSLFWKNQVEGFRSDYVGLTADGARWIVARGIRLVGADYLSVASFSECPETHRILMAAEVAIVEGLNLSDVAPGAYELICLPLKLVGTEGAPARAVLRPLS